MIYVKPAIYTVSHVLIGFIAVWFPVLAVLMVAYQIAQYMFDVRFFLFSLEFKKGNSFEHTFMKLAEMGLGYGLGLLVLHRML